MTLIRSLLKMMLISSISSSLFVNSVAAATNINEPSEGLIRIANTINTEKLVPNDLISRLKKVDPRRARELESFIAINPNFKNIKIPKVSVENGKLGFMIEGKKNSFSIDKNGGIDIWVGDKNVRLEYTMTFEEMFKKISETLNEQHYSIFNFLIQDSNAGTIVIGLLVTALVAMLVYGYAAEKEFVNSVDNFGSACKRISDTSSNEVIDFSLLQDSYNKLTEMNLEICAYKSHAAYNSERCSQIPEIKKCFKTKINQIVQGATNDSSRSQVKDSHYEVMQDKFVPGAATGK